jgi:hypothetical protein
MERQDETDHPDALPNARKANAGLGAAAASRRKRCETERGRVPRQRPRSADALRRQSGKKSAGRSGKALIYCIEITLIYVE